jgi:hypothetical protein
MMNGMVTKVRMSSHPCPIKFQTIFPVIFFAKPGSFILSLDERLLGGRKPFHDVLRNSLGLNFVGFSNRRRAVFQLIIKLRSLVYMGKR